MADDGDDEHAWFYTAQLDAFELYHIVQEETRRPSRAPLGPALPALGHATSGAIGSAVANLLVYPLDVAVTRVQVAARRGATAEDGDEYTSILSALRSIYTHEGGLSALYSGVGDSLVKSVLDSFLFFLAYNFARHARQSMLGLSRKRSLPVLEEIGVGMLAGAAAKLCTTPVQNVVTRKQTAAMRAKGKKGPSARAIAAQIYRDKGWTGFWAGYSASLILTVNPALTFLLQGMLSRLLVPRERRKSPGARLTFLMAAASKAVASTITYPVSVAKTRAQAGGDDEEGEKQKGRQQPGRPRARTTILAAIVAIARREGAAGLYRGLGGEVLKGFFTHGLTMLMKEHIHVAVIQLYYLILKALRRFPSTQGGQLVGEVASSVEEAAGEVKELVGEAVESGKEVVQRGTNQVGEAVGLYGKGGLEKDKKE
ncbi:peroxisomal adenine nucleotide transporter 1 [Phyllosticta capitalensis]|uniref:Peroxisomal adenine nucleotide transporter 1 n=1 Tax=Phyllosticta capitalensis TaxID=121624 RepID=A0ABR1YJ42_9PEZI